jgi:hypothetical protein
MGGAPKNDDDDDDDLRHIACIRPTYTYAYTSIRIFVSFFESPEREGGEARRGVW